VRGFKRLNRTANVYPWGYIDKQTALFEQSRKFFKNRDEHLSRLAIALDGSLRPLENLRTLEEDRLYPHESTFPGLHHFTLGEPVVKFMSSFSIKRAMEVELGSRVTDCVNRQGLAQILDRVNQISAAEPLVQSNASFIQHTFDVEPGIG